MRYGSVCSGIEAATVAWEPLGWKANWLSEIDPFPSAVLAERHPTIPNLGDMTAIHKRREFNERTTDLLVGGTPCQSFSVAGLRKGMDDPRGNLALVYLRILDRVRARWMVWENVPGVLSSNKGRDFGAFLGALEQLGYGFAYRTLDAQHFGVPQRRRRVFVVGYLGDWRRAAAVLFERESMLWNSSTGKGKRQDIAPIISARTKGGGGLGTDFDCDGGLIAHTLRAEAFDGIGEDGDPMYTLQAGAQHGIVYENHGQDSRVTECGDVGPTVHRKYGTGGNNTPLVAAPCVFEPRFVRGKGGAPSDTVNALTSEMDRGDGHPCMNRGAEVRRLTPRECERLQGFSDDYTRISWKGKTPDRCPDGPRYRALGNSMAVPVMAWIGERIQMVEDLK